MLFKRFLNVVSNNPNGKAVWNVYHKVTLNQTFIQPNTNVAEMFPVTLVVYVAKQTGLSLISCLKPKRRAFLQRGPYVTNTFFLMDWLK